MLVLSRKRGEALVLWFGDVSIELTMLETKASRVAVGITAPDQVKVLRKELTKTPPEDPPPPAA